MFRIPKDDSFKKKHIAQIHLLYKQRPLKFYELEARIIYRLPKEYIKLYTPEQQNVIRRHKLKINGYSQRNGAVEFYFSNKLNGIRN
eukprot:Pgem_evm1s5329